MTKRKITALCLAILVAVGLSITLVLRHHNQSQQAEAVAAQRSNSATLARFRPQIVGKSQELYNKGLRGKALVKALQPEEDAIERETMATIRRNNEALAKTAISKNKR